MRHASFFSGAGGLDLGFERAGITTVSVSEIDPYANAVLAERFPGAPNLGSITEVEANDIPEADIWSGGFPCQDLSTAGKRAGFAGQRSSLAFKFLNLVEQRRPRWLVLENVPGLFTSNHGRDFAHLLNEMDQRGYGYAWRTLDAQHFGVPQRRRRVFIVAADNDTFNDSGHEWAAQVLLECEGCEWHPQTSIKEGQEVAARTRQGTGADSTRGRHESGQEADPNGMREADGLARRLDNQPGVDTFGAQKHRTLQARDWKVGVNNQDITALSHGEGFLVGESVLTFPVRFGSNATVTEGQAQSMAHSAGAPAIFRKAGRAQHSEAAETWVKGEVANTLNSFDVGDIRTTHAIVGGTQEEDNLLPVGLDGHRYRLCGNGVVAPVAEWIGRRIVEVDRRWRQEEAK